MGIVSFSKIALVLIVPFLIVLIILDFAAFDGSFYDKEFSKYGVREKVVNADFLHGKVMSFIRGESASLPDDFDVREKTHLEDVRSVVRMLTISLYFLIALFALLLIMSGLTLKVTGSIRKFAGTVMLYGGLLTILIAAVLYLSMSFDFGTAFESFHGLFFGKGTYIFDPSKEVIVNLYPEGLFMDVGLRISKGVLLLSAVVALIGMYLVMKPKRK